jgi:HlyD family secretion protein
VDAGECLCSSDARPWLAYCYSPGELFNVSKKILIVILVILAVVAAGAAWQARTVALEVAVTEVNRGDVIATVANTRAGTVEACRRSGLSPPLGGQLAALPISKGDRVTAGQILLELRNDDKKAELLFAKREAIATDGRADETCVRSDVASREAERLKSLQERGLASEEETDRAVGDARAKIAGCKAARDAVTVSQAQISIAKERLELTILRAPFDGIVAEINGELGEFVTPSPVGVATPAAVDVIDTSCLYISAPIDEVDAPAVKVGQPAIISLDAFPDGNFTGVVRRVAPYVLDLEKQARTVEIEAEIDLSKMNPEAAALLPGYSADIEVILDERQNVIRIPSQVIVGGDHVYVLENDIIREREIETGLTNWEFSEILDGLAEGDWVVLSVDREGVEDGASVKPEYR